MMNPLAHAPRRRWRILNTYDVIIIDSEGDVPTLGRRVGSRKLTLEVEVHGEINGKAVQAVMPASAWSDSRGRRCRRRSKRVTTEGLQ